MKNHPEVLWILMAEEIDHLEYRPDTRWGQSKWSTSSAIMIHNTTGLSFILRRRHSKTLFTVFFQVLVNSFPVAIITLADAAKVVQFFRSCCEKIKQALNAVHPNAWTTWKNEECTFIYVILLEYSHISLEPSWYSFASGYQRWKVKVRQYVYKHTHFAISK